MALVASGCSDSERAFQEQEDPRSWLAGDHHIHSQFSVGWDRTQTPPTPIFGGAVRYSISQNAAMARKFGLSWMVATDHGGPNHSKINLEQAYPELLQSRRDISEVIQFYGMELDTPAGEHSSLIIPHSHDEADVLYKLELNFGRVEVFPVDSTRNTERKMLEALTVMQDMDLRPLVIANHPARTATGDGVYVAYDPEEFRRWNDTAPDVAVGMAGAPGHQAFAFSTNPAITDPQMRIRGGYRGFPTMGGFDQLTAKLGGFWDSMLGEGRHWWITANSDSHVHFSEGGGDFWPGEYSKTYVYAEKSHDSIMEGIRAGNIFVTTGDLVSELFVEVVQGRTRGGIGEEIEVSARKNVTVSIRVLDPDSLNAGGRNPEVNRIDLIVGDVTGISDDPTIDSNSSVRVVRRFTADEWEREGEFLTMDYSFPVDRPIFIRVRGTNTDELEPVVDPPAEDPWSDLWFYSNPVFVTTR